MSVADDDLERDDRPDEEEAAVLSGREAMSLITGESAGGGDPSEFSDVPSTSASLSEEERSDAGSLEP